jgi:hypothetical protein
MPDLVEQTVRIKKERLRFFKSMVMIASVIFGISAIETMGNVSRYLSNR